jgi:CheY-like chemotaxis protein
MAAPFIVVVEDDHLQEGPLEDRLSSALPGAEVVTIPTEREFREALPMLCARPPDAVVMDVMLRWDLPSPDLQPPPEVLRDKYFRAGLRCAALLRAEPPLRRVPVVLYSILELADLQRDDQSLPDGCSYVSKSADVDQLIRRLRALIRPRRGASGR